MRPDLYSALRELVVAVKGSAAHGWETVAGPVEKAEAALAAHTLVGETKPPERVQFRVIGVERIGVDMNQRDLYQVRLRRVYPDKGSNTYGDQEPTWIDEASSFTIQCSEEGARKFGERLGKIADCTCVVVDGWAIWL